jgi:hypothetical protein
MREQDTFLLPSTTRAGRKEESGRAGSNLVGVRAHGISTHTLLPHRRPVLPTEAEHRSTFYIPYWNVPLLRALVPRQRAFAADIRVINDCLDELITRARASSVQQDEESLQARDYSQVGGWVCFQKRGQGEGGVCLCVIRRACKRARPNTCTGAAVRTWVGEPVCVFGCVKRC